MGGDLAKGSGGVGTGGATAAPIGPAGGGLSGTYPNPAVIKGLDVFVQTINMNLAEITGGTANLATKDGSVLPSDALILGSSVTINTGITGGTSAGVDVEVGDDSGFAGGWIMPGLISISAAATGVVETLGVDDPNGQGAPLPLTPRLGILASAGLDTATAGDVTVRIMYIRAAG